MGICGSRAQVQGRERSGWLWTRLAVAGLIAAFCAPAAAPGRADDFAAWPERASADGRLLWVNGVHIQAKGLGWVFAWGDGTVSQSFFPAFHRYDRPGTYQVTARAFLADGTTLDRSFSHTVRPKSNTGVATVSLGSYALVLLTGETASIPLSAAGAGGAPVAWTPSDVALSGVNKEAAAVSVARDRLVVSAARHDDGDAWGAQVYVSVKGVFPPAPLNILVTRHPRPWVSVTGRRTLWCLPEKSFMDSVVPVQEFAPLLDLAHGYLEQVLPFAQGPDPGVLQGIGYCPPAGGISGNPLLVGDWAFGKDQGWPVLLYCVIVHEMTHNLARHSCETTSEWAIPAVTTAILNSGTPLSTRQRTLLEKVLGETSRGKPRALAEYRERGAPFEAGTVPNHSNPFLGLAYGYAQEAGDWRFDRFMECFGVPSYPALVECGTRWAATEATVRNTTHEVAALSFAFDRDALPDALALKFLVDVPLYNQLLAALRRHAAPRTAEMQKLQRYALTLLTPATATQGYGELRFDRSCDGNPLRIAGKEYARGIGTHAASRIAYHLNGRYRRFEAEVGVDDECAANPVSSVVFQVLADGKVVFDSGVMRFGQPARRIDVSLEGVNEMALVVTDADDGITCDHADWGDARLTPK